MPQLKTYPWWPSAWLVEGGPQLNAEEVRKQGVLKNVSRSEYTLTFVVDCAGSICRATVHPHLPEDTLILLRHILLRLYGEPIAVVEDLDVDLQGVFPIVKENP